MHPSTLSLKIEIQEHQDRRSEIKNITQSFQRTAKSIAGLSKLQGPLHVSEEADPEGLILESIKPVPALSIEYLKSLTRDRMIEEIAYFSTTKNTGLSKEQIRSSSRERELVWARFCIIKLMTKHTTMSYANVAHVVGRTNHATIHHAIHTFDDLLMYKGCSRIWEKISKDFYLILKEVEG